RLGVLTEYEVGLDGAGDRDHESGALDPRALEDPHLGGVAVLDGVLELLLDAQVALAVALHERDLVILGHELAGQVPADLPAAGDQHVHVRRSPPRSSGTCRSRAAWARSCARPA